MSSFKGEADLPRVDAEHRAPELRGLRGPGAGRPRRGRFRRGRFRRGLRRSALRCSGLRWRVGLWWP